ncbi:hypothetical protein ACVIJW_006203 [Bradyrhizobium barranii subsp. barranii]
MASTTCYRTLRWALGPEEIGILTDAYGRTLRAICLIDRNDPITDLVAKKIIELGQRRVREAMQLSVGSQKSLASARQELLRKARQAETGSHMSEWRRSPGLQPPK